MVAHQEPKVEEEEIVKVAGGPDLRGLMSWMMLKVRNIRSMMTVTPFWKRSKTTLPHCSRIFIKIRETKKNSHRSSFRAENCILSFTCRFSGILE